MVGHPRIRPVSPFALYPLRLGLALVFTYTGIEKLADIEGNAAIVSFVGLPAAEAWTVAIGVLELLAAVAILLGVMTRTAAAGVALFSVLVILTLKVPGPFWSDGWGIDLVVLAGAVTLAINGPGRPTLWSMMGRPETDPEPRLYRALLARVARDKPADP